MLFRIKYFLLFAFAFIPLRNAYSQDWYLSAGSRCSGSTALSAALATYFSKSMNLIAIPPAGNFAIKVSMSDLSKYVSNNPFIYDSVTLDERKASSLRLVLKGSVVKVPLLFKLTNAFLINFVVIDAPLNVGVGVFFDYFYQSAEATPIEIENIIGYIAIDGKIESTISVRKSPNGGRFILTQTVYSVRVGSEIRAFVLEACQFPVAISVTEFQTSGQYNNKIVKPRDNGIWGVFDIEDNKWDSLNLTYKGQEADNYIFESDEIEDGGVIGKATHRLSLIGGAWSKKRSSSSSFSNLYLNITAK